MSYEMISSDDETDNEYLTVNTFNEVLTSRLEDVKEEIAKDVRIICADIKDEVKELKSQLSRIVKEEVADTKAQIEKDVKEQGSLMKSQIVKDVEEYVSGATFTMLSTKNIGQDLGSFQLGIPSSPPAAPSRIQRPGSSVTVVSLATQGGVEQGTITLMSQPSSDAIGAISPSVIMQPGASFLVNQPERQSEEVVPLAPPAPVNTQPGNSVFSSTPVNTPSVSAMGFEVRRKQKSRRFGWDRNKAGVKFLMAICEECEYSRSQVTKKKIFAEGVNKGLWPEDNTWMVRVFSKVDNIASKAIRSSKN